MITIRRAATLGNAHSDTLILRCHFAFADYQDPAYTHDGRLRVLNLGKLAPAQRYYLGPEANVDILTWLFAGSLISNADDFEQEDIGPGGLHLLSTGTGCQRIEWSAGLAGAAFIQFWFMADVEGVLPAQEIRASFPQLEDGGFRILASGFPEDDPEEEGQITDGAPVALTARARLLHAVIPAAEGAAYSTTLGRDLYLLVVSGIVTINGNVLHCGDAAAITDQQDVVVIAQEKAELLLADVSAK
ncbi:hypothetical protein FKW31_07310 [Acetobacter sp. DmW_136]|uniref:pirin family protein n=1 Tax=Acetobacter sp. DmW_136 TaxID=2591091 RepID=UPI00123BE24C|nr:hypothetical protein [Acetobacter sp. DmW_136]KAA8386176.1 hypothetical protein FKW31_07310 [Acetobacter sp. DmW_136]